ncbi:hypothetical protein KKA33_01985 [Patescibacteria group bacterium]|nr:hypothetical protein [Patescibacteria group bacterium]
MPSDKTQKFTFAQFGDLLQQAWEDGHIGEEVHESIESGVIPIRYLREKLRLVIERSDEEGYLDVTQLADIIPFPVSRPQDNDQLDQYREAA